MGGREGWGGVWPKKVARSLPVKNLVALKKSHRSDFMSWGGRLTSQAFNFAASAEQLEKGLTWKNRERHENVKLKLR